MSGHSHWAGIKHKKGATDQKRGVVFSKLLMAITIAAKLEPNPDFNPRLRTTIQKARENNVPAENIERAIKRAGEAGQNIEEAILEAYGPGGVALFIEATTDNTNRTVPEVKKILSDHGGKWAEPGSVRWAFESQGGELAAKFKQPISQEDRIALEKLIEAILEQNDVQKVHTNTD